MNRTNPIHNGEVTHHQDQSMCPVNFKTKNIKNKTIFKLIPPFFSLLPMLFCFINYIIFFRLCQLRFDIHIKN